MILNSQAVTLLWYIVYFLSDIAVACMKNEKLDLK